MSGRHLPPGSLRRTPLTTAAIAARLEEVEVWSKPPGRLPSTDDPYTYTSEPFGDQSARAS